MVLCFMLQTEEQFSETLEYLKVSAPTVYDIKTESLGVQVWLGG